MTKLALLLLCMSMMDIQSHSLPTATQNSDQPIVSSLRSGKSFECYRWSDDDRKLIRQGKYTTYNKGRGVTGYTYTIQPNSSEMEQLVCQSKTWRWNNFVYTRGDASKAPGCGKCYCCKPL